MQEEKASEQTLQGVKTRAVSASQLVSSVTHAQCSVSAGQELYQLSKEKADFSVAAGEEDESTAGSSGENDGNSRSSTPHSSIKSPPSKSPAKAQKAEGKMVLSGEEPGAVSSGSLPSVRGLMIPPFTWISGIMGKAVQILGLAQYELSSTALRCPGLGKRWMGTALMMLFRLVFAAPTPAGHSPLLRQCWP